MNATIQNPSRLVSTALCIILVSLAMLVSSGAQSTAITYQGRLTQAGAPATGQFDLQFTLKDALTGGATIAGSITKTEVPVSAGIFTVELDFGAASFSGEDRWLEIAVRSSAGGGAFTTLTPRQPLTANPYSLQTRGIFVDNAGNVGINPLFPALRSGPTAASGATRQKQITSSDGSSATGRADRLMDSPDKPAVPTVRVPSARAPT